MVYVFNHAKTIKPENWMGTDQDHKFCITEDLEYDSLKNPSRYYASLKKKIQASVNCI